jgi:hypothetical protein
LTLSKRTRQVFETDAGTAWKPSARSVPDDDAPMRLAIFFALVQTSDSEMIQRRQPLSREISDGD